VQAPEECDDGNKKSGDGCSSTCNRACETCELAATFSDMMFAVQGCYKDASIMMAGPAAGVPKNELCTAFVDCARRTSCFVATDPASGVPLNLVNCYCKNTDLFECAISPDSPASVKEKFKPGDCKVEMEELMGTDLGTRIVTEVNESPAASLLYSDWAVCSKECKVAEGDCRRLLEFIVQAPEPPKAPPNGTLALSVSAYDNFEQPISIKWSVEGGGSFSDPNATSTMFTCPATAGSRQISVEASVGSCVKTEKVTVECQP
jgi:cysteine-rich repeat protein